jgi:hypothetical protein
MRKATRQYFIIVVVLCCIGWIITNRSLEGNIHVRHSPRLADAAPVVAAVRAAGAELNDQQSGPVSVADRLETRTHNLQHMLQRTSSSSLLALSSLSLSMSTRMESTSAVLIESSSAVLIESSLEAASAVPIECDEFAFDRANWMLTYTRYAARPLPDAYYVECAAQWKRQSEYEAQHETKLIVYPDATQAFTKSACTLDVPNCPRRGDKSREYVHWEGEKVFVNTAPCCRKHLHDTLVDLLQCQQTHLPDEVLFLSHGAILGWRRNGGLLPHVRSGRESRACSFHSLARHANLSPSIIILPFVTYTGLRFRRQYLHGNGNGVSEVADVLTVSDKGQA